MTAKAQKNDIKYHYQLSHFFNIIDEIRKELHVLEVEEYNIPFNLYEEALKLLNMVE